MLVHLCLLGPQRSTPQTRFKVTFRLSCGAYPQGTSRSLGIFFKTETLLKASRKLCIPKKTLKVEVNIFK